MSAIVTGAQTRGRVPELQVKLSSLRHFRSQDSHMSRTTLCRVKKMFSPKKHRVVSFFDLQFLSAK